MKKITLLLYINAFMFTCVKSMEMEVEECNNHNSSNTSESSSTINAKSNNSNPTDKLLKQNLEATKTTNILLYTLIMQNKTNIEYQDNIKHDTRQSIDLHAKDTKTAFDILYKSTNAQLKDKTLHIPMTGKTVPTTTQTKSSKTEDII